MKRMPKLIALLVVLGMVLSLIACTTTSAPAATTAAATEAAATSAAAASANASAAATATSATPALSHDPITITGAIFMEPIETSTIKTDPVSKFIQNKFGITLNIINNCIGSSWTDANPALIASNDLPDLFYLQTAGANGVQGMIKQLVDANEIYPLDDLVAKYAPDIVNNTYMQASTKYIKTFFSPDGKLYSFPEAVGAGMTYKSPSNGIAIRWDAYKAAGYPAITSLDTLADALKKMQDVAAPGVNGKKAYGVGGWFADSQGWGDWELTQTLGCWVQNAAGIVQQYMGKSSLESNSDLVDINGPYWSNLKFYNKCYRTGILDPDAFTMKWDDWNKAVEDGTVLFCSSCWIPTQKNSIIGKNISPDAGFVILPPLDQFGDNYMLDPFNYGAGGYAIAKTCKYPERLTEFMNWVCSEAGSLVLSNGPEGGAWNMVNGVPTGNPDYLKLGDYDTGAYKTYGANLYHHFNGFGMYNLRDSVDAAKLSLTSYEKDALNHFNASFFTDKTYFGKVTNDVYAYPLIGSFPTMPDDLMTANNNISNFYYQQSFKAVQAKTDDELNAVFKADVDFFNANKGPDILKWYLDNEAAVKAKLDPICNPVIADLSKK